MDAQLERILADGFLDDLTGQTVSELRNRRGECRDIEGSLSYLRRLVQGRHDIVVGEVKRRADGGDPDDAGGLVDQLPEILADRGRGPDTGRMASVDATEMPTGALADRLDGIDEAFPLDAPHGLADDQLTEVEARLRTLEHDVSTLRRSMFDRIDALEAELTDRYASGEANVDDLLARRRG